jgi:hypothetical protein
METMSLGYLDLTEGLNVQQLLPSAYSLECENGHLMGANQKDPGGMTLSSVQPDQTYSLTCQECHLKMELCLGEPQFVRLTPSYLSFALLNGSGGGMKKRKAKSSGGSGRKDTQSVGLVLGQSLPQNGSCEHYKKSFRWLKFPCCGQSFPCDICHDLKSTDGHTCSFATRMRCGFCSKEQPFSNSLPCSSCGKELTKSRSAHGFWEGGQGTRDRTTMSRRENRKYQGLGKTVSNRTMQKQSQGSKKK